MYAIKLQLKLNNAERTLMGSIPKLQIAHRLEVWGYTNKTRLRGF